MKRTHCRRGFHKIAGVTLVEVAGGSVWRTLDISSNRLHH